MDLSQDPRDVLLRRTIRDLERLAEAEAKYEAKLDEALAQLRAHRQELREAMAALPPEGPHVPASLEEVTSAF